MLGGNRQSVATAAVMGGCLRQKQSDRRRVPPRQGVIEDEVHEVSFLSLVFAVAAAAG